MPLTVVSFATYLSAVGTQWRDQDWDTYKFIKAVKGKPFKYSANIPVVGTLRHLGMGNANDSLEWFAEMANAYLWDKQTAGPLVLIPLPNSSCALNTDIVPRTYLQALALGGKLNNTTVLDCLRWKVAKESASGGGGTRNPQQLYDNLAVTGPLPQGARLVIIDDVRTSGGHLKAARAMLLGRKGHCDLAICAGRTVWNQVEEPFSTLEEQIPDWWPMSSIFSSR
jgi:hypothetical protein